MQEQREEEKQMEEAISQKVNTFNPLAIKSVIVQRKINGLLYTIEASTLLSGQTIQIVAEDEYFKQFKETWRVKNL